MWSADIQDYESELIAGNLTAQTRALRVYHLRRFAADHPLSPLGTITRTDLIAWLAAHDWSAETRRSYRASLRRFFAWAHACGRVAVDPAATLPAIRPPRALPRPTPDVVLAAGLAGADERVRLMLELIDACGLRRGEVCRIHSRDVVPDLVGYSLRIQGKGGNVRIVPVPARLARQIIDAAGWVFPGAIEGHLSPRRVGELVAEALPDGWTAHTLRHRFATRAYSVSHDLRAVQELLGHAKPETTAIYTMIQPDRLRAVAEATWAA
ncbi:tyrosine-type recombinase/integrase [Gordonia westfalica]|nr:tyrosine-type recombinase/integrase [Gordonia westfalica]SDU50334.1 Site-specific recombinase XerD [Gordonia westfalica]